MRLLLDRDHRREAEDEVDVGLGDLRDEALGVTGERLHVAALPFGVDGVEGEARLARAGQAGDDDQRVARDLERDVLQVVNARALDARSWSAAADRAASPPASAPCVPPATLVAIEIEEGQFLHVDVAPAS